MSVRSHVPNTNLKIRSQWRDDGILSLTQTIGDGNSNTPRCSDVDLLLLRNQAKMTSLGREEAHVSILLVDQNDDTITTDYLKDFENANKLPIQIDNNMDNQDGVIEDICTAYLTLDVPEKINLECDLKNGGSIVVENKIEGDVRLRTGHGDIIVKKLRGHTIDLEIGNKGEHDEQSTIFVSEVLESQSLRIAIPDADSGRIRAKRIHASNMEIRVGGENDRGNLDSSFHNENTDNETLLLDEDDSGAICDISSLYIIGDANVNVQSQSSGNMNQRQAVRIKSHHGHVHLQTCTSVPDFENPMTGNILPSVDLGGVNGSCEVWISQPELSGTVDPPNSWTSCHVHFDSMVPDSVSVIHTEWGNVNITVDRKVESDIRLLSPPSSSNENITIDMDAILLDDNEDGTLADELVHMLKELDATKKTSLSLSEENNEPRIQIQTKAFTETDRPEVLLEHCEFMDGWVENTTSEPDSRFDRKIRGNDEGSRGKIRLEGAYDQALQSFQQKEATESNNNAPADSDGSNKSSFARPILAVSSPGKIVLETLSWMGNIARRYGLDEAREKENLGRQATRRRRLLDPTSITNE